MYVLSSGQASATLTAGQHSISELKQGVDRAMRCASHMQLRMGEMGLGGIVDFLRPGSAILYFSIDPYLCINPFHSTSTTSLNYEPSLPILHAHNQHTSNLRILPPIRPTIQH